MEKKANRNLDRQNKRLDERPSRTHKQIDRQRGEEIESHEDN